MRSFSHGFCKAHSELMTRVNVPDYIDKSKLGILTLRKNLVNEWFIGVEMSIFRLEQFRIYERLDEVFEGEAFKIYPKTDDPSSIGFVGIKVESLIRLYCKVSDEGWKKIVDYVNIFGDGEMNPYGELWNPCYDQDWNYNAGYHLGKYHFNNLTSNMIEPRPYLNRWLAQLNNIYHTIESMFDD